MSSTSAHCPSKAQGSRPALFFVEASIHATRLQKVPVKPKTSVDDAMSWAVRPEVLTGRSL